MPETFKLGAQFFFGLRAGSQLEQGEDEHGRRQPPCHDEKRHFRLHRFRMRQPPGWSTRRRTRPDRPIGG
jgi:hypothetical protein